MQWWRDKGCHIINERTINLAGLHIGYVPIENLLTDEELNEVGDEDSLLQLIGTMNDDGMKVEELIYKDGSHELRFFVDYKSERALVKLCKLLMD